LRGEQLGLAKARLAGTDHPQEVGMQSIAPNPGPKRTFQI